ncbi:hypothetical protein PMIN07_008295 [Paraphaeosphaeria minitans]
MSRSGLDGGGDAGGDVEVDVERTEMDGSTEAWMGGVEWWSGVEWSGRWIVGGMDGWMDVELNTPCLKPPQREKKIPTRKFFRLSVSSLCPSHLTERKNILSRRKIGTGVGVSWVELGSDLGTRNDTTPHDTTPREDDEEEEEG